MYTSCTAIFCWYTLEPHPDRFLGCSWHSAVCSACACTYNQHRGCLALTICSLIIWHFFLWLSSVQLVHMLRLLPQHLRMCELILKLCQSMVVEVMCSDRHISVVGSVSFSYNTSQAWPRSAETLNFRLSYQRLLTGYQQYEVDWFW